MTREARRDHKLVAFALGLDTYLREFRRAFRALGRGKRSLRRQDGGDLDIGIVPGFDIQIAGRVLQPPHATRGEVEGRRLPLLDIMLLLGFLQLVGVLHREQARAGQECARNCTLNYLPGPVPRGSWAFPASDAISATPPQARTALFPPTLQAIGKTSGKLTASKSVGLTSGTGKPGNSLKTKRMPPNGFVNSRKNQNPKQISHMRAAPSTACVSDGCSYTAAIDFYLFSSVAE